MLGSGFSPSICLLGCEWYPVFLCLSAVSMQLIKMRGDRSVLAGFLFPKDLFHPQASQSPMSQGKFGHLWGVSTSLSLCPFQIDIFFFAACYTYTKTYIYIYIHIYDLYIKKTCQGPEIQGSGRKLFSGHSHLSQDEPTFDKLMNSVLLVNFVPKLKHTSSTRHKQATIIHLRNLERQNDTTEPCNALKSR